MGRVGAILFVVAAIALPSIGSAQKLYKWKDENGVIQYGDKIPPEYANRDRQVLNNQGVRVGSQEGEVTDDEAEANRRAKDEAAHDRMLLDTYISVADIERLRDQRLEQRESQIKLTEVNLNHLRKRLAELQAEASNYKPYSTREDAPQVPEAVARDLSQTTSAISKSQQDIARMRADQAAVKKSFDDDIVRFRELKGE
ncbi:MAG TPA: DUF4124 domain-containing protein [Gammaproteobacteria bacterium]|nr:DUF4124 domain-containing protein [Gammaproteobacteria bacterium]